MSRPSPLSSHRIGSLAAPLRVARGTIADQLAGITDGSPNATMTAQDNARTTSRTISAVIASVIPVLALLYFLGLFWTYRYAKRNPRPFNKSSGIRVHTYAPVVYVFMVVLSLAEIGLAIWLLLQYRFNDNAPNATMIKGTAFVLFSSCWTTLTGTTFSILFIHPRWSKHPISSIGVQAIWIFFTWLFWVIGTGIVNQALPWLLSSGSCLKLPYCGQMQAFFALSVIGVTTLTGSMIAMTYLAWRSSREVLRSST
ncbi:hypothetical protein AX16_007339 [Volvariella volvacea WC 439]|nr:hypothetical protein AX16_007339 [Volvariella volvacea WC 439]